MPSERAMFASRNRLGMVSHRHSLKAICQPVSALARTALARTPSFPLWPQRCGAAGLPGCLLLHTLCRHSRRSGVGRGGVFYTSTQHQRGMRRVG